MGSASTLILGVAYAVRLRFSDSDARHSNYVNLDETTCIFDESNKSDYATGYVDVTAVGQKWGPIPSWRGNL